MDFAQIRYRRNFLTEVIARVDFPSPITEVEHQLPPSVSKVALSHFPVAEPRTILAQEFQLAPPQISSTQREVKEWNFHGREREKKLVIGPLSVFVRYTIYHSYETLRGEFLGVLNAFFDSFGDAQASRLGLRYINNIKIGEGKPLIWNEHINSMMLCLFEFSPYPNETARVFSNLEFNFGDLNLRYQFGMHNPDYPAPIRKRQFVLDLDAYFQGPQDRGDITKNLNRFHDRIQQFFELSITDQLRNEMNA